MNFIDKCWDWLTHSEEPEVQPDVIEEVNRILAGAHRDIEQLDARAARLVELHGYERGSREGNALELCIWSLRPYEVAIKEVFRIRRQRLAAEQNNKAS